MLVHAWLAVRGLARDHGMTVFDDDAADMEIRKLRCGTLRTLIVTVYDCLRESGTEDDKFRCTATGLRDPNRRMEVKFPITTNQAVAPLPFYWQAQTVHCLTTKMLVMTSQTH